VRDVVLDWGDAVMRVFPECRGPMAEWPVVEAVAGIEEALSGLAVRWRLRHPPRSLRSGTSWHDRRGRSPTGARSAGKEPRLGEMGVLRSLREMGVRATARLPSGE
jgi:hypothetical protein